MPILLTFLIAPVMPLLSLAVLQGWWKGDLPAQKEGHPEKTNPQETTFFLGSCVSASRAQALVPFFCLPYLACSRSRSLGPRVCEIRSERGSEEVKGGHENLMALYL